MQIKHPTYSPNFYLHETEATIGQWNRAKIASPVVPRLPERGEAVTYEGTRYSVVTFEYVGSDWDRITLIIHCVEDPTCPEQLKDSNGKLNVRNTGSQSSGGLNISSFPPTSRKPLWCIPIVRVRSALRSTLRRP